VFRKSRGADRARRSTPVQPLTPPRSCQNTPNQHSSILSRSRSCSLIGQWQLFASSFNNFRQLERHETRNKRLRLQEDRREDGKEGHLQTVQCCTFPVWDLVPPGEGRRDTEGGARLADGYGQVKHGQPLFANLLQSL
jgi:hypothetical protein